MGKGAVGGMMVPAGLGDARSALPPTSPLWTHLYDLQFLLGCFNELGNGYINKLVLRLCLHHAGALRPHHLDGLLDVNVTV